MNYRTALVTGASSGVGLNLSQRMARDGVEVILAARRVDLLEELADDIRQQGGAARICPLDVTDPEETKRAIAEVDVAVGGLDLVVANAGVAIQRWSGKLEFEHCQNVIDVNVTGTVATLTSIVPAMVKRQHGQVVAISSLAQYRGLPKFAVYSASKAFISTFVESLRVDLSTTGVVVTDVRPGFIRTPLNEEQADSLPFLVEVDDAAETIWKGIQRRQAVVEFPWQLAAGLKSLSVLPAAIYDPTARKVLR